MANPLNQIEREVEAGLPNEQGRLAEAIVNADYLAGDNEKYIPSRPAENWIDFANRTKRTSQITRRVVEVLCDHLYNPGPSRTLAGSPEADAWLAQVYGDNHINALLYEADTASTLNHVSMIQVAATGDAARPITLTHWDSSQYAVYLDPDDCRRVQAVVTIDRYDEQTRYTLWTDDQLKVFTTQKLGPGQTSGGRTARLESVEPNEYGFLPFAFFHYSLPCREFWTASPGTAIRKMNASVDIRLSALEEAASKHLNPVGIAINVDEAFRPILRPGDFLRLPAAEVGSIANPVPVPDLKFLQAVLDFGGQWSDLNNFIDHSLECFGVPASAIRLEQSSSASGIRIIAEQAPLLSRARRRQPLWSQAETRLASVVLAVGAYSTGRTDLAAAASDPHLDLSWPEPRIPIPDQVADLLDQWELDHGLTSEIELLAKRRGFTRDQALAHLKRIAADKAELTSLGLTPTPPATPAVPTDATGPLP